MEVLAKNKSTLDISDLEHRVKKMYREVALYPHQTYHFEMGRGLALHLGYPKEKLKNIPKNATDSFAGVGYFFDLLHLQKGETVVDLGSGSGMDLFYAANEVGQKGKAIGVDMTSEQLDKSLKLSAKFQFNNVYIQKGYIERLPISSAKSDAVISNGVINLSADKESVFIEAARILKPGGRLAIADIVTTIKLPEKISCNATLWAACIGGAMQKDQYIGLIEKAGLRVVAMRQNPYEFISKSARNACVEYGIESVSILAVK